MKKIYLIIAGLLMTASVFAQAPQKMSYQAVIRNSSNALIVSTPVGMQISILQGSSTGTAVYVETQTVSTNANGLVSLEIGSGTPVTGAFAGINWATGPYFIKTEPDPTGGINYTIEGTNEIMSVPFALHSKTADNGITPAQATIIAATSGTNTGDQDISGILTNSTAITTLQTEQSTQNTAIALNTAKVGITPAQAAIIAATSGTNTGDQDGSETKVTAGTNVTVTGSGTTASPYVVNSTAGGSTLAIGDSYQGGIIFWLDATGQHGLIAATADQSTGIQWYNGTYRYTGTTGDGLYAGAMNTTMIVATQMADNQAGNFAAKVCADYSVTVSGVTYGDWYLPSKYELNLLYLQKTAVGGFASAYYWSSAENGSNLAWNQDFDNGFQFAGIKNFLTPKVRAVRAF